MAARPLSDLGNLWALNIKCTQHVTHWRKDFMISKLYIGGPIAGIGGIQIQLAGQRTIKLTCNIWEHWVIMLYSNMLYCLTLGINLISVSQLFSKRSINVIFHQDHAKIHTLGQTFIVAQYSGLYLLNIWFSLTQLSIHAYLSYGIQNHEMSL